MPAGGGSTASPMKFASFRRGAPRCGAKDSHRFASVYVGEPWPPEVNVKSRLVLSLLLVAMFVEDTLNADHRLQRDETVRQILRAAFQAGR